MDNVPDNSLPAAPSRGWPWLGLLGFVGARGLLSLLHARGYPLSAG